MASIPEVIKVKKQKKTKAYKS